MKRVFIRDASLSDFGKLKTSLIGIIQETFERLDMSPDDVDAVFIGLMNPEGFTGVGNIASYITDKLGIYGKPAVRIETASSTGAAVFYSAYAAVKAGLYKNVLVIGAEKMTSLSTREVTGLISQVIDPYERKTGLTMPALAAIVANRFRYESRIRPSKFQNLLAEVAIKNHFYGSKNPAAHFKKEITREKYFSSKYISEPLRLFDCSPVSDGAAAIVLSSEKGEVEILGIGQGTDRQSLSKRETITSFDATIKAATQAYQMAGIAPESVDFAEIHDAFTPFEILGLLDTGLLKRSEIEDFYLSQEGYHDGRLPVNISGGLKSRGHPLGASGLAQIAEAFKIMTDLYPHEITPEKKNVCLTQSVGGLATNNFVTILRLKGAALKPAKKDTEEFFSKPPRFKSDSNLRIYSHTRLYSTTEGVKSPLDLVICEHNYKKFFARYSDKDRPRIKSRVKISKKENGIVYVKQWRRFSIKG